MKKIILSVAAVLAFGFANAQDKKENSGEGFSKGDVFVSGTVNFGSSKNMPASATSGTILAEQSTFTIAPAVGYFVTDNIALGIGLGYTSGTSKATSVSNDDKSTTVMAGLMGRYYFTPSSKFSGFLGAEFDYMSSSYTSVGFPDLKVNGFGFGIAPGFNYFISKNFALEASYGALNYSSAKADVTGAEASTEFKLNLDLTRINLGLNYKF